MSCRSGEAVGMTTRSLLDTGLMYLTGEGTSLTATVGAVDRETRWASMYRGVHTSVQERQVRRSQMKGRSRRVNYYQLIRLTRSPNDAKITRYFLTSMTGYLPAMPTRGRAHPNGSPLSTSIIRSILAETT